MSGKKTMTGSWKHAKKWQNISQTISCEYLENRLHTFEDFVTLGWEDYKNNSSGTFDNTFLKRWAQT